MNKTISLFTLLLLVLLSCNDNNQKVTASVEELTQTMLEDPAAIEYYTALYTSLNMFRDGNFPFSEYQSLVIAAEGNHCNIKKEAFNGNINMENFSKHKCFISKITPAFNDKYPMLKDLEINEKKQIALVMYNSINLPTDIEARKVKALDSFNQLSDEEKKIKSNY